MSKNVTWSFFLLHKLALLSQKMKIQNHTILVHIERFVVPKNQFILYKTAKKYQISIGIGGGGGRGSNKLFLKSHNSAHTCRIDKRFLVFCSSSDAFSADISLTQKVKNQFSPFCVSSNDHKQFNQKHSGQKKQLWRCPTDKTLFFIILINIMYVCSHNCLDNTCRWGWYHHCYVHVKSFHNCNWRRMYFDQRMKEQIKYWEIKASCPIFRSSYSIYNIQRMPVVKCQKWM